MTVLTWIAVATGTNATNVAQITKNSYILPVFEQYIWYDNKIYRRATSYNVSLYFMRKLLTTVDDEKFRTKNKSDF